MLSYISELKDFEVITGNCCHTRCYFVNCCYFVNYAIYGDTVTEYRPIIGNRIMFGRVA